MDKPAVLRRSALFGELPLKDLKELSGLARERELAAGEILFLAGEEATGLYVIASGVIRAFRVNSQGKEQTIHTEREGATLAEVPVFDDGTYPATAVAEKPSTLLVLSKTDVREFMMRHPALALTALRLMAKRLRSHADLVDSLAFQQVGQRLARIMLLESRERGARTSAGVQLDLSLSNSELARRVGSVREVVSRTLSRLEREGLLTLDHKRRRVLIPDEAALATYAGE